MPYEDNYTCQRRELNIEHGILTYTSMERLNPKSLEGARKVTGDFFKERFEEARKLAEEFAMDESSKAIPHDTLVRSLRMAAAGAALYSAMPGDSLAGEKRPHAHIERHEKGFSKADFELVAKNIFFEASIEAPEGQLAVAQVTFARIAAKRKYWGSTAHSVVYAPYQFSWTAKERKLEPTEVQAVKDLARVLHARFKGKSAEAIVEYLSNITDLPADTLYYKRADWREDSEDEKRMTERTKEVFQNLIWLKNIGRHAFYMEAPNERIRSAANN